MIKKQVAVTWVRAKGEVITINKQVIVIWKDPDDNEEVSSCIFGWVIGMLVINKWVV
jgi:hypothetical protein